jgi:hypothetical protein
MRLFGRFGRFFFNVADGLTDAGDLFGVFIRNLDPELLFKGHHKLNRIEGICAKIIDKRRCIGHILDFDAELFRDDGFYFYITMPPSTVMT